MILQSGSGPVLTAVMVGFAAIGVFSIITTSARLLRGDERRNEELARSLLAATGDAIAVVEDGERLVEVNGPYLRLTRARETQAPTPERFLSRIPGAQAPMAMLLRSISEGVHVNQFFPFDPEPDGRRLTVGVYPLEGARRVLWVLTVTDPEGGRAVAPAADRQRPAIPVPLALAEADGARVLAELWETAPVGLLLLRGEAARLPNGTCAHFLGYDLAEWGQDLLPLEEVVDPVHHAAVREAIAQGSTPADGLDVDLVCRDGTVFASRLWINGTAGGDCIAAFVPRSATRAMAGQESVAPAVAAAAAPVAAAPSETRRSAGADAVFFSRSPLAMAMVDRAGRVVEANGSFSRLFAGAAAQLIETRLDQLVSERDAAAVDRLVKDMMAGAAQPAPVEVNVAGEGGRSARLYVSTLGPTVPGLAVYAVDTTAQRALEVQFAQSQKMQAIGQLAGGVAHDFNNVLTAILGYCDLLLTNHRPSDPSFPDIMQIKQNANRAAGLVRQLLAFSRRQTLRPQVIQLTDVISELSMLLRRLIGERITLDVQHGRDLWPVKVDVNQFEQVIVNLAVNARDAMSGGGVLTLRTANVTAADTAAYSDGSLAPADYVLIEVTDTGSGIPAGIIDKIFEPFFSTKEVGKGTGLGLSTVYGIVKQTGGNILVQSREGEGTTFRVFLPRYEASETEEAPPTPEPEARTGDLTGQATVLLVEDEDAVRAFASRALSARGYNVVAAASGAEALQAYEESSTRIELVVSDVVMPEMDGPTLLRELRARDPNLKVIFISGYAEEAFSKNLPEGEKFSFLPKPFTLKQLVAAVKEATRR
ncbi:response regulator [Aquabacter sp. L1I39]|uniref:response regulator n=1 Tax=Aquabacter sp. L1I39 TaxID=2820278 RepID=UPI001ADAFCE0|nr:response regulator [Aquabacter sp. L1I39]QTL03650.1 response regulator [Aquabacter sp. L1I39]